MTVVTVIRVSSWRVRLGVTDPERYGSHGDRVTVTGTAARPETVNIKPPSRNDTEFECRSQSPGPQARWTLIMMAGTQAGRVATGPVIRVWNLALYDIICDI